METTLAQVAISSNSIVWAIVMLIVAGLVLWILNWAIAAIGLPEPMAKVAKVCLILFAALIAINAILTLVGHPIVTFR